MNGASPIRRRLLLTASIAALMLLFVYVVLRSGPMAPITVTVEKVRLQALEPAVFGIGTVEARRIHRLGPTVPGRLLRLDADVGDVVKAGQLLGEMDPVDLDQRLQAQVAAVEAAKAAQRQARARRDFASTQAERYASLLSSRAISEEIVVAKRQEADVADAALAAASQDLQRLQSERQALAAQRGNLQLHAPADGLVVARHADPGTTVVAGQAVLELVDPTQLWVDARFDQASAEGLAGGLPADVKLRSRPGERLPGQVLRLEPLADAVTEELGAKIGLAVLPQPPPPLGELAEVTVRLPPMSAAPTIPNAAIRVLDGRRGVWKPGDDGITFVPIELGRGDLAGQVQVRKGLAAGERVVVYSAGTLGARSRIRIVESLTGGATTQ